jgi:hypothetical protein
LKSTLLVVFGSLLAPFLSSSAYAQDACDAVLTQGVFNLTAVNSSKEIKELFEHYATYTSYENVSAGISLPVLNTLVGGNFTKESFTKWQESAKQRFTAKLDLSLIQKTASKDILDAWSDCHKQNGIFASLAPLGDELALLTVVYRPGPDQPQEAEIEDINVTGASFQAGAKTKQLRVPLNSARAFYLTRQGTSQHRPPIGVVVKTAKVGDKNASLSAIEQIKIIPPLARIKNAHVHFKTHGDNKEGGTVTVVFVSAGKEIGRIAFPEENWGDPSERVGDQSLDIEQPKEAIHAKVILQEQKGKNISWIFDADARLEMDNGKTINFAGQNVPLDTSPVEPKHSAKVEAEIPRIN